MNEPRLAKMHLGVDNARKNVKALAVDPFARPRATQGADLDDPSVADANVAEANPVVIDQSPVD
jgi:hypothetical protein